MPLRRLSLLVAVFLMSATTMPPPRALAQAEWTIRAGVGPSLVQGKLGDDWGSGIPVTLSMHYAMSRRTGIGAEFSYQELPAPRNIVVNDTIRYDEDSQFRLWRIGFGMKRFLMSPEARLRPYAALGLSAYPISITSEDSTGIYIRSYAGVGFSPGLGVDYRVGPAFGVGFEARYHMVSGSEAEIGYGNASYLELSFGFRFIPGEE